MWMFIEELLVLLALNKSRNAVLAWKDIIRNESGDWCGLVEAEYVCSEYFWDLCKTYGLGHDGDETTVKDRLIDLDRTLWFMLSR